MLCLLFGHKGPFIEWKLRTQRRLATGTSVSWTEQYVAAVRDCRRCGAHYWAEEKE